MPIHTHPGQQVPAHLQRASIPQLSLRSTYADTYVKGKVLQKFPLTQSKTNEFTMKAVIQELNPEQKASPGCLSINVVLNGALAKDFSDFVSQEDTVSITGFTLAKSPTAGKDNLHACQIELAGPDASVYVSPAPSTSAAARWPGLLPVSTNGAKWTRASASEVPKSKYTYAPLSKVKPGVVVNVYGVVTFFKQPFRTKGTDYCSTLKITDESDVKIGCTIFSEKLEEHPKIYKTGDIVRLHRVKCQMFGGTVSLLTSHGFSCVTFDGTAGTSVIPRASSRSFHFSDEDKRRVEQLRLWASSQPVSPSSPSVRLADVKPRSYFDLTCQLLGRAKLDESCVLLKVWDGTRCSHPLLSVTVDANTLEGNMTAIRDREQLVVNVLVFDNHVETAMQLQLGSYLRIYNLHAVPQPAVNLNVGQDQLSFHLHGGTSYGRGMRVLPKDSPDLKELCRNLELVSSEDDLSDSLMDMWGTPPESMDGATEETAVTERTCHHALHQVTLSQVGSATALPQVFHVRAKLRSYQPVKLHQCLKLHCPRCKAIQDVPDDDTLATVFEQALHASGLCNEDWTYNSIVNSSSSDRLLGVHLYTDWLNENDGIMFLEGATLQEACLISEAHRHVVPVRRCEGRMSLLQLSAPFLLCGPQRYYGCKKCSHVTHVEPITEEKREWNVKSIADALGIQTLHYVFLLKFLLEDESGWLEAVLWSDVENFFGVSPCEASYRQDLQERLHATMERLCPPANSAARRPWLDLCLASYTVEENDTRNVCYHVLNTRYQETTV